MTPAELATTVKEAASRVLAAHDLDASVVPDTVTVERPRNPEHGDYATNIALQVAKKAGTNPRDLAGWLADDLSSDPAIDAAEEKLGSTGRVLLRPSGTEELFRVMVEAADAESARKIAGELAAVVAAV